MPPCAIYIFYELSELLAIDTFTGKWWYRQAATFWRIRPPQLELVAEVVKGSESAPSFYLPDPFLLLCLRIWAWHVCSVERAATCWILVVQGRTFCRGSTCRFRACWQAVARIQSATMCKEEFGYQFIWMNMLVVLWHLSCYEAQAQSMPTWIVILSELHASFH